MSSGDANTDDLIWTLPGATSIIGLQLLSPICNNVFKQYIEEPNIGHNEDLLSWYHAREQIYKYIVPLTEKNFCIVVTPVPGEQVFFKISQLISAC